MKGQLSTMVIVLLICPVLMGCIVPYGLAEFSPTTSQYINSDTTWTAADSPHTLTERVVVPQGVTLTIEPGTVINLNDGKDGAYLDHNIYIEGTLIARGTTTKPITVKSDAGAIVFTETAANWDEATGTGSIVENINMVGTIKIDGSSPKILHNLFSYLEINDGSPIIVNNNIKQAFLYGGSPTISNNQFETMDGQAQKNGSPTVTNNIILYASFLGGESTFISNNLFKSTIHFVGHGGTPIIRDNYIIAPHGTASSPFVPWVGEHTYTGPGIVLKGDNDQVVVQGNVIQNGDNGIEVSSTGSVAIKNNLLYNNTFGILVTTDAIIQNNNFLNNWDYYLYSKTIKDIDATNNYWETTDIQAINQKVYDHQDFSDYGLVTVTPFLTAPNPNAPTLNFNPLTTPLDVPAASPTLIPTVAPTPVPTAPPDQHQTMPAHNSTVLPEQTAPQTVVSTNISLESVLEITIITLLLVIIGLVLVIFKRLPSKPRI